MAHITVSDTTPRDQYTATAAQVDFTVSYPFFTDASLTVYQTGVGDTFDASNDLLTLSTDYSVTGAGNVAGVTRKITLTTGATAGDVITIVRTEPYERTSDYQDNGDLLAETLNDEQDLEIMLMQQLKEETGRALLQPVGDTSYYDVGTARLANVGDPSAAQDAATRSWVLATFPTASTDAAAMKNMVDTYGAVGDGTVAGGGTVENTAFTNAAAAGGTVYIPPGNYRITDITSGTLTQRGTKWIGAGKNQTIIIIDHTSSVGLVMEEYDQMIANLTVQASDTRAAEGYTETWSAIRKTKEDSAGAHAKQCVIENVEILDEPGNGIALGPSLYGAGVRYCNIADCGGNGIIVDNGSNIGAGLTNVDRVGGLEIAYNVIHDCGGHSIRCGSDDSDTTQYPYRIDIRNNETYRCATDAAVRKTTANMWVYGENIEITQNGIGSDTSTSGAGTVSNLFVAGRSVRAINNRYINGAQPPITVGNITTGANISTRGVTIDEVHVSGMAADADPLVEIDSAARFVKVTSMNEQNITSMVNTDAPIDTEWQQADLRRWDIETLVTRLASIQSRSVADDGFTTLEFGSDNAALAVLHGDETGGADYFAVLFWFRAGTSPAAVNLANTISTGTLTYSTGALTGTTGTDTHLTISPHTDNKLYIENRLGSAYDISVLVLNNLGGDLLRSEI